MGLTDEFFWSLSPALFARLVDRLNQRERRANLRAAMIACEFRNSNRTKETDKFWLPTDLFPEDEKPKAEQTDEEMLFVMNQWVARTNKAN